jgi:hypothetical protein
MRSTATAGAVTLNAQRKGVNGLEHRAWSGMSPRPRPMEIRAKSLYAA